jgi:hypothetical protein
MITDLRSVRPGDVVWTDNGPGVCYHSAPCVHSDKWNVCVEGTREGQWHCWNMIAPAPFPVEIDVGPHGGAP